MWQDTMRPRKTILQKNTMAVRNVSETLSVVIPSGVTELTEVTPHAHLEQQSADPSPTRALGSPRTGSSAFSDFYLPYLNGG